MGKVASCGPFLEVGRSKDANLKFLSVSNNHYPTIFVPYNLGVTELSRVAGDDWISFVGNESVASIMRVRNGLRLRTGAAIFSILGKGLGDFG